MVGAPRVFRGRPRGPEGRLLALALSCALLIRCGATSADSESRHGSVERIVVHGQSLEGNLEGDSPDREVSVYLPAGYRADGSRRYPVVYLLHGFTDTDERWFGAEPLFDGRAAADRAFSGAVPEMIIVMPNARTRYFGSMYSDSPTTGDWEHFVARDLVTYIDHRYRTIADRASRGLAGHSMGGYGALRLGMKFPAVFSSVYALSACCLQPANLQDPVWANLPDVRTDEQLAAAPFMAKALFASAAAWSPDPSSPPWYLDLPRRDGKVLPDVVAKWAANSAVRMVERYASNLRQLQAIALDVGTQDSLIDGVRAFDRALSDAGVAHTLETYDGDHLNRIERRFGESTLPFLAHHLRFVSP